MKQDCTCEEMLELINELIDGSLEGEKLAMAESLIRDNPRCRAMFHTVSHTIALYRSRRNELEGKISPSIDWESLEKALVEK